MAPTKATKAVSQGHRSTKIPATMAAAKAPRGVCKPLAITSPTKPKRSLNKLLSMKKKPAAPARTKPSKEAPPAPPTKKPLTHTASTRTSPYSLRKRNPAKSAMVIRKRRTNSTASMTPFPRTWCSKGNNRSPTMPIPIQALAKLKAPRKRRTPPLKQQTISFLDLPPEIRDMIYKLSCTPDSIKTIPTLPLASVALTGETLPWAWTLMPVFVGLCQQARTEFAPLLLYTALLHTGPISFTVIDFDFRPVIEFFKRLSPSDRETLTRHASFKVCLEVHRTPDLERLYKWLQFQADKRMEGARWTYHLLHPYWGEDPSAWSNKKLPGLADMERLSGVMVREDMRALMGVFVCSYVMYSTPHGSPVIGPGWRVPHTKKRSGRKPRVRD